MICFNIHKSTNVIRNKLQDLDVLPKGFMVVARHDSHLGNFTLVSRFKRSSLISLLIICCLICPNLACHFTYLGLERKYKAKAQMDYYVNHLNQEQGTCFSK